MDYHFSSVEILHVSGSGCHPWKVYQKKGLQVQHANVGGDWYHYIISILEYTQFTSTNLQCCDIKSTW